jgi:OFA family oxalate/formate antiporter-like MFS transporter
MAVLGSCIAIFWPGALTFAFPGVMAPLWQEMFQVGRAATGLTIFFMLAAVGIFMFLVGRWQERWGLRRMMALGLALTAFASLVAASAQSIYSVYAWAALNGMASCFVYVPALTLVQWCYPMRRGLVAGTVSMVFGLAAAIMSPLFGIMLEALGYRNLNLAAALLTLSIGLLGAYFARAPQAWETAARARRAGKDARAAAAARRAETMKAAAETTEEPATQIVVASRSFTVTESLHTKSFWMLWATWTFAGAAGVSMTILATGYGLFLGFALPSAILLLTAFNLANGTSRLASGILSDRFGRNWVMSLAFLAAGLAYLALPWTATFWACAFLAAVVGFSFGTLFSVSAPLVADCFGLDHFGAIFGLSFAAYGFVAGPLGPTLSGYVLDLFDNNYTIVFLYLGVFCLLASFLIRQVVPPRRA